jgi:uncharacterized protein (DUF488 family)
MTFGHGTLSAETFVALLADAGIEQVIDIRSFPGSRHNPQYGREEMERWLPTAGVGYRWIRELGGRRRPVPGSKHIALRNESFRAFADHMETPAFLEGLADLMRTGATAAVTVMCSESVWWRCHRRLLADHLVEVDGIEVFHLMHDGRLISHIPTDGLRLEGDSLVYDVGAQAPLSSL